MMTYVIPPHRAKVLDGVRALECLLSQAARETTEQMADQAAGVIERYQRDVQSVLELFLQGDEEIAWWTQVELYAGLADFRVRVALNADFIDSNGNLYFVPPRSRLLEEWAGGVGPGPRFRGQEGEHAERIDTLRETFVRPFSEAPPDMLWAPILDWRLAHPSNTAIE